MSEYIAEIKQHHSTILDTHRAIGGRILEDSKFASRAYVWVAEDTAYSWGADYKPGRRPVFAPLDKLVYLAVGGKSYDPELGMPDPSNEAWLTIAHSINGGNKSSLTHFDFGTGVMWGLDPYVSFSEETTDIPFRHLGLDHLRGGQGRRKDAPYPPLPTTNPQRLGLLATNLQLTAQHILEHGEWDEPIAAQPA